MANEFVFIDTKYTHGVIISSFQLQYGVNCSNINT